MRNTTLVKILLHANHDPLVRVGHCIYCTHYMIVCTVLLYILCTLYIRANHDPLVRVGQSSSVNGFYLNDQHFLGVRVQYVCLPLLALQTGIDRNDFNTALLKYYHQQQ